MHNMNMNTICPVNNVLEKFKLTALYAQNYKDGLPRTRKSLAYAYDLRKSKPTKSRVRHETQSPKKN